MREKTLVVIQNTEYHFETAMSVYKSLEDAGADVYIHRCCKDVFGQEDFVKKIGMKIANYDVLRTASCGFVVSAYPNPNVSPDNAVPNVNDPSIKIFGERIVYLSHRFSSEADYVSEESPVKRHNSLCLSPLSEKIGMDYFSPIDMPFKPELKEFYLPILFSIQGHFKLRNRLIRSWIASLDSGSGRAVINMIGSNAWQMSIRYGGIPNFRFFSDMNEELFYRYLNHETHFIMPLIDPVIKNGTYVRERYSSNFNQAFAMEKPVICHEHFREIYGIPGIYYNDSNTKDVPEKIFSMTPKAYKSMVGQFSEVKAVLRDRNSKVLSDKVAAVGG